MNIKLEKLMKKMEDMEKTLGKRYDEIKTSIRTTIENQDKLNTSLKKLQRENKIYRDEIIELKDRVEVLERDKLDSTFNLYPVLEIEKMDLNDLVQKIGKKIGVKIEGKDILDKYRRPTRKSGKPGDIVIKCVNRDLRDKILQGIKKCKLKHDDIGIKCDIGRIYGNEELTKEGKSIYYRAMRLKYEEKWKFLWIRGGRTYLKRDDSSKAIRLDNMEVLDSLCRND